MAPRTATIAVAQYEIPLFKYPHIHWSLVAFVPGTRQAMRYHIVGNTDSYGFDAGAIRDLLRSTKLMGGVKVAEIPEKHVANGWLEDTLRRVPIVRNDPSWHCQSWTVDAIRSLRDHVGWIWRG
uniref:Extracellular metalloproteinase 3 ) n=1 Tax=Ganoderma boninense TaxID=34458 RepID=A0A5K1JZ15_9APHY|nr:Extracellular metalloproteinase 3 (EC (Fungalysin MEP3) [Ganoderma boninense]